MKTVFVTGATGFIGRNFTLELIKNGIQVHALTRNSKGLNGLTSTYINLYDYEIDEIEELKDSLDGMIDVFYHLAWDGANGLKKSDFDIQLNNIKNTIKCLDFAEKIGCKKFICTGTVAENIIDQIPDLDTVPATLLYGAAKFTTFIMTSLRAKSFKLQLIWVQLSNVYGLGDQTGNMISYTLNMLHNNNLVEFSSAETYYDFVSVVDVVNALKLIGERKTKQNKYFVGSGKPKRLKEYLIEIGEIMNKKDLIGIGLKSDDGIEYKLSWFSIEKIKNEIGYNPSKSFRDTLEEKISIEKLNSK